MKEFLFKIFKYLFFLSISYVTLYVFRDYKQTEVVIVNRKVIDSAEIIIAGDSRAERQIDPNIVGTYSKRRCLNIAEASMDLYSLTLRLKTVDLRGKTIIISASSWQINDGSTENGYFRLEAFQKLSMLEKFKLYSTNLSDLITQLNQNILSSRHITVGRTDRGINQGYSEIKCQDFDASATNLDDHPWYQRIEVNGVKRKLLADALSELNKLDCERIIIYNGPVSPTFIRNTTKKEIWKMENLYTLVIKNEIERKKLMNISFFDLRNLPTFEDKDFYDPQHLCQSGAIKFSKIICNLFSLTSAESGQNNTQLPIHQIGLTKRSATSLIAKFRT